jgi:hypothetical protein
MSFIYVPSTSAISPPYGSAGTVLTSAGTTATPIWEGVSAQGFITQTQSVSTAPTVNSFSIAII